MLVISVYDIRTHKILKVFPCSDILDGWKLWNRIYAMVKELHLEERILIEAPENPMNLDGWEWAQIQKKWASQCAEREAQAICDEVCKDR